MFQKSTCNSSGSQSKIKDTSSYQFKLDNKKCRVDVEVFCEVLEICPRLPNQEFIEPPSHEEIVSFIKEIGYGGDVEYVTDVVTDHMYQPWRTFTAIINRCLSRKITDFMFQIENKETSAKRWENMPYPRFTKAIIQYFISKDKSISMRNIMFMHTTKNDSVLGTLKFIPKGEDNKEQQNPKKIGNGNNLLLLQRRILLLLLNIISDDPDDALELTKSISRTEIEEQETARLMHETHERLVTKESTGKRRQTCVTIRDIPAVSNKKTPIQTQKLKGIEMIFTSGSSEGAGPKPEVLDESKGKTKDINEGAGLKPEVPDVSKAMSLDQESKNKSWGESEDDNDDCQSNDKITKSNDEKSVDLNKTDDEEGTQEDEFIHTPDDYVPTDDETQDDTELADEGKGDEEMTDAEKVNAELEEVNQEVTIETEIISMLDVHVQHENQSIQTSSLLTIPVSIIPEPLVFKPIPEIMTTAPAIDILPPIPLFISHPQKSTPIPTPTTTEATTSTPTVPEYETYSAIQLKVSDLEKEVQELKQADHSLALLATI
ncbi:hypothetical protein Tco_1169510 [Tanacetum coccineum]